MGLTQSAAAVRMHFARHATISDHERDKAEVSEDVLSRYARLYGVTAQELRYGVSRETAKPAGLRERPLGEYGLSEDTARKVDPSGLVLLRMPPDVYSQAYDFLADMEEADISRPAQDRVEALLTQVSTGQFTPGYDLLDPDDDVLEVNELFEVVRRMYARRGVTIGRSSPPSTEDPDAVSGAEMEGQLKAKKLKGKRAG